MKSEDPSNLTIYEIVLLEELVNSINLITYAPKVQLNIIGYDLAI
jgi:hypothetical protein